MLQHDRRQVVTMHTMGFVYFIRAGTMLKIGFTFNLERRLRQLQTACPHKLEVLLLIPGTPDVERAWHHRFRRYCIHGEWFYATDEIQAAIRQAAESPDDSIGPPSAQPRLF